MMVTKQLVIMVFVSACYARAQGTEDRSPEQINNTIETVTGKLVPPGAQLISFSHEDSIELEESTEESNDTLSGPVKSTTVTAEIVKNATTQNEAEQKHSQDLMKTEKTPSTPKLERKVIEKKSNEKDLLFEGVPKINGENVYKKGKRETGKEENNEGKPSNINQELYSETVNTENSQNNKKEEKEKGKNNEIETKPSTTGSSRRTQNSNKGTSESDQFVNNDSKGEQVIEKNNDSTNKQPSRIPTTLKNKSRDYKSGNREKSIAGEENKPVNRDDFNDKVFDYENWKNDKMKTKQSTAGSSRRAQNSNKGTSESDQIVSNESKGEQVRENNSDSTNKQPSRISTTVKNKGRNSESGNREKPIDGEGNKPVNRDDFFDNVFDYENSEPKLDNYENEDSAKSNIRQTKIPEEPNKQFTSRTDLRNVNNEHENRHHRTSSKSTGYVSKFSPRRTTQGRQANKIPSDNEHENIHHRTSSKSTGYVSKFSPRRTTQGRQANKIPCDRTNEAEPENQEESDDAQEKKCQGESKSVKNTYIQGAESKILPLVENINVTTVLPTTETNKSSSAATTIPTTVRTNQGKNTLQPSNNATNGNSTSSNAKSKNWKKALDIIGRVICVFTVIGGAFYLIYSLH